MCRFDVQRCCVRGKHSGHRESHSGVGRKPFAFPPESLFAFSPESRSPSPRNAFHVRPGILFTFARNPQTEADIEIILQAAKEKYPEARPRIISDNGPQFIAKDFKEFIRISGMTHVRTSPFYPQSNGKIERWHKSLKGECIRPGTPLSLEDARRLVEGYVEHYNNVRLNSAVGYITPKDMLAGRQRKTHAERDRKLEEARRQRQIRGQNAA